MIHRKIAVPWCAAALLCLRVVTAAPAEQPQATGPKPGQESNYRIGAGDVLLIEVAGEPDLKRKVKVLEQGTIRLPYIERDLKVEGLTEIELSAMLREQYLSILKEPQVTIYIEEYGARAASIVGAVNKPLRLPLTRPTRVIDLISAGGGLSEKAGRVIQLIHTKAEANETGAVAGSAPFETIDLVELWRRPELNRELRDGDVINVPEVGVFYVSGSVNKPGAYPLKDSTKLSQAIALAGGPALDAKKKEIHLFRSSDPTQAAKIERVVNLAEIEKDPSKDILLQPYDIILIPEASRSKSARTLLQTFVGGLANAAGFGIIR